LRLATVTVSKRDFGVHSDEKEIMNKYFIEINELNFDREVLYAMQPVLVEFWAGWSASCRDMAPMLESLAGDDAVTLKVARVNVEHHEELAERYGVRAVPTLLIFNQGGVQDQIVGRTTEQTVRQRLERFR
jgi:thioredoxin 1